MSDTSHGQPADPGEPESGEQSGELVLRQADAALDRRNGMRRRHRTTVDALRDAWRVATAPDWPDSLPWWTPAVDAVIRAMADRRDPTAAVTRLGRERAAGQIGLAHTLDELNVVAHLATGAVASADLVRAAVTGWRAVNPTPVSPTPISPTLMNPNP